MQSDHTHREEVSGSGTFVVRRPAETSFLNAGEVGRIRTAKNLTVPSVFVLCASCAAIPSRFVRDAVFNKREFEWESQLRFYWERDADDIAIRQCAGEFG